MCRVNLTEITGETKITAQMHLKLPDVKEVHLCNVAIVFVSIVLSNICKKHNRINLGQHFRYKT